MKQRGPRVAHGGKTIVLPQTRAQVETVMTHGRVGVRKREVRLKNEGALKQERLLSIAPKRPTGEDLAAIFRRSMGD